MPPPMPDRIQILSLDSEGQALPLLDADAGFPVCPYEFERHAPTGVIEKLHTGGDNIHFIFGCPLPEAQYWKPESRDIADMSTTLHQPVRDLSPWRKGVLLPGPCRAEPGCHTQARRATAKLPGLRNTWLLSSLSQVPPSGHPHSMSTCPSVWVLVLLPDFSLSGLSCNLTSAYSSLAHRCSVLFCLGVGVGGKIYIT